MHAATGAAPTGVILAATTSAARLVQVKAPPRPAAAVDLSAAATIAATRAPQLLAPLPAARSRVLTTTGAFGLDWRAFFSLHGCGSSEVVSAEQINPPPRARFTQRNRTPPSWTPPRRRIPPRNPHWSISFLSYSLIGKIICLSSHLPALREGARPTTVTGLPTH